LNGIALEKNDKNSLILLVISILNFSLWLVTGWIFLHKDFSEYEIIIPMFILMLNTIVALTTFVFGACLLRRHNKLKILITLVISGYFVSVVFSILYRDWSSIINV